MRNLRLWATPAIAFLLLATPVLADCATLKDCSSYSSNSAADMIGSVACGVYNLLACTASPLMFFVFVALAAFLISAIFGLFYFLLSRR